VLRAPMLAALSDPVLANLAELAGHTGRRNAAMVSAVGGAATRSGGGPAGGRGDKEALRQLAVR
jgi:hypothetical protein